MKKTSEQKIKIVELNCTPVMKHSKLWHDVKQLCNGLNHACNIFPCSVGLLMLDQKNESL